MIRINHHYHPLGVCRIPSKPKPRPRPAIVDRFFALCSVIGIVPLDPPPEFERTLRLYPSECWRCARGVDECECDNH